MKEKYIEFLNMAVVDTRPIKKLRLFKINCDGGNFCLTDIYSVYFYRR